MNYPYSHAKPLRLRDDQTDYTLLSAMPHFKSKRKALFCKKLKGDHDYQWFETKLFSWSIGGYTIYKCSGCTKQKYKGLY